MAFQGKLSILSYTEEMINNFLGNEKLIHFQTIYSTFQSFKETMETMDDLDLDDWYYLNKSVLNDFISLLIVMKKSKKLMEVQSVFCEHMLIAEMFEKICAIICEILECERATLFIVDKNRKELWSKHATDENNIIRLQIGSGIAGTVAEQKELINLEDAYFDKRFNKENDTKTGYRTKSLICVPIIDKGTGECIGKAIC